MAARRRIGEKTARERLNELLDPGTFVELDKFFAPRQVESDAGCASGLGEGVVTGYGRVAGRDVYVFSRGDSIVGDTPDDLSVQKIIKVMDLALKNGAPLIGLNGSGGGGVPGDGSSPTDGWAEVFFRNVMASGVVPQISAVMGVCTGGEAFPPAVTDFVVMVKGTSHLFVSGPEAVSVETGEEVTFEELGGAAVHDARSGVAHLAADDEAQCLKMIRKLLCYLPQNNLEEAPYLESREPAEGADDELDSVVPEGAEEPYDMRQVVTRVVDGGEFFEIQSGWARNLLVGFARLGGRSVGVVSNQPAHLAGALDIDASVKGARFVRFCDAFNIPLVIFEDVPGFLPGKAQEHGGIVRGAAKLLYAFCEATVPKVTVIVRKANGAAYDVMCSKHVRADFNFAWPSAEITPMVAGAGDDTAGSPYAAARRGYIDDIIEPRETRVRLMSALEACASKREGRPPKKHGNIPL
jgi:propionyl-CoA carboxylase beta chain